MDTKEPDISVIVPAYNEPSETLQLLHDSLVRQSFESFEVVVVDDCSPNADYSRLKDRRFRVIYQDTNTGPGGARNTGAKWARAPVLFFTDADCSLHEHTLAGVAAAMAYDEMCMGDTITEDSSFMGRAVGYLGFPGGGLIGFANVWPVDADGYTDSVTSCNFAICADTFHKLGGFDETFPVAAGEDTMFARSALEAGLKIRHVPEQIVYHEERSTLSEFMRWQVTRGRGTYHVMRRVGRIGGYVGRRFRSLRTSVRHAGLLYGPIVVVLFGLSLVCQLQGFRSEARRVRASRKWHGSSMDK